MYFLVNKYDINRQFEYTFYLNRAQPFTAKNHGKAGARNSGYSSFKSKLAQSIIASVRNGMFKMQGTLQTVTQNGFQADGSDLSEVLEKQLKKC